MSHEHPTTLVALAGSPRVAENCFPPGFSRRSFAKRSRFPHHYWFVLRELQLPKLLHLNPRGNC
jgi:hypothetical protein